MASSRSALRRTGGGAHRPAAGVRPQADAPAARPRSERVVDDVQKMLRRLIGEDIELVVQLAADLRRVQADPSQVEQVIVNLAVNARDAMPRGGRSRSDRQRGDRAADLSGRAGAGAGDYAALIVEDTGEGIDPAILGHIFEPFFTTKPLGRGTGLGLADRVRCGQAKSRRRASAQQSWTGHHVHRVAACCSGLVCSTAPGDGGEP